MSGYMLPVAMEVFRGRFVHGFDKPAALVRGQPEEFVINLHQINHVFKKGHRVMVQVQSSWFPIIDRNPQVFVKNIFEANDEDFRKEVMTVYYDKEHATRVELPVMR